MKSKYTQRSVNGAISAELKKAKKCLSEGWVIYGTSESPLCEWSEHIISIAPFDNIYHFPNCPACPLVHTFGISCCEDGNSPWSPYVPDCENMKWYIPMLEDLVDYTLYRDDEDLHNED